METPTWLRRAALGALWALALLGIVVIRSHRAGVAAMERSDAAFDRGELVEALTAASEASSWYFPFAPHVAQAHERQRAIALGAESTGNRHLALRAYGAIRGSLLSTAHPGWSAGALLNEANAGIARSLPGAEPASSPSAVASRGAPRHVFHAATTAATLLMLASGILLITRRELRVLSIAVAVGGAGFFLWVFSALGA